MERRASTNVPDVFSDAFDFARDTAPRHQKPALHHEKRAKAIIRCHETSRPQYLLPLEAATLMLYFKPGTPQECMLTWRGVKNEGENESSARQFKNGTSGVAASGAITFHPMHMTCLRNMLRSSLNHGVKRESAKITRVKGLHANFKNGCSTSTDTLTDSDWEADDSA
jgi:hypothetical protein